MFAIFLINVLVIIAAVAIHYEFLHHMMMIISKMKIKHRLRIVFGVLGALIAHSIEVFLFAIVYYFLHQAEGWGNLAGDFNETLLDCIYFSFTTYTTLGFGDIQPHGYIRTTVGLESLTGLLLITWTASFLYYEMQQYWGEK